MIQWRNRIVVTGMIGILGLGLTGCGETAEPVSEVENLEGEPIEEGKEESGDGMEQPDSEGKEADGTEQPVSNEEEADTDADKPAFAEAELYGDILELGDGQFTISEITVEEHGEEEVMVMGAPGNDSIHKITVTYDEDTVFIKQKIWDGGESHEEREGTSADLKEDFTVEMKGNYEGDIFHATEIKVVEVIL